MKKIAAAFPDHDLVIAGRGQETNIEWVRQKIKGSPYRERIQCLVNTSEEEKKRLFHSASFVCMPSRFEGWNIAAIEAAASSRATIGTRIQGLSDAIKDNETGLLVPVEDVDELAKAMTKLLSDDQLRERLAKKGYLWAKNFTLDKVAEIQENFYKEVAKK